MFPREVSREAHDVPGKILVSKENVDGKMVLPGSSLPREALFENWDRSFAKYSHWVRQS